MGIYWAAERLYFATAPPCRRGLATGYAQRQTEAGAKVKPDVNNLEPAQQTADAAVVVGLDGGAVPGDFGGVCAALVFVRAVQDPVGFYDPDAARK